MTEFYGNLKDSRRPRLIKIKRITNTEKTPKEDVSIVKQRLKSFNNKLQQERKDLKEQRFKEKRNLTNFAKKSPTDADERYGFCYVITSSESSKPSAESTSERDKKFKPILPLHRKREKVEEIKTGTKTVPPTSKHMAEDDQESNMTINNKKVHFITLGGYNKSDSKPFQNRLSSSDDDYDYYQIYDEIPRKNYKHYSDNLNFIHEEQYSDSGDSDDSNRADRSDYEYPDFADDEDEVEGKPPLINPFNPLILGYDYGEKATKPTINFAAYSEDPISE